MLFGGFDLLSLNEINLYFNLFLKINVRYCLAGALFICFFLYFGRCNLPIYFSLNVEKCPRPSPLFFNIGTFSPSLCFVSFYVFCFVLGASFIRSVVMETGLL